MEKGTRRWGMVAASVAGLLAAATSLTAQEPSAGGYEEGEDDTVACYGINKCQGAGDCAGAAHACAGQNACKGQGFLDLPEETCLRIEGGRLSAEPA